MNIKNLSSYRITTIIRDKLTGVKKSWLNGPPIDLPIYFIDGKEIICDNEDQFIKHLKLKTFL